VGVSTVLTNEATVELLPQRDSAIERQGVVVFFGRFFWSVRVGVAVGVCVGVGGPSEGAFRCQRCVIQRDDVRRM
jgi:hypothetical protein